jgi:hypothetical protein
MTLRRPTAALVIAILATPGAASAASYETTNFTVEAPTAELAKKFGEMAEFYRKEKAIQWLGQEMPPWPERCPLHVRIEMGSAGGATTFTFGTRGGRPAVSSQRMEIRGEAKQLLSSVLPHEVTHTVLAYHFGRPVPRWADEGGSVLSENEEERYSHDIRNRELLNAGRGIVLRTLFRMADYPRDMIVLYAQGYSVTAFLVDRGGGGRDGRSKLLQFLAAGMGNDSQPGMAQKYHGTPESWNEAARKVYGFESVDAMEKAWLDSLKTPPSRVAAREAGTGSGAKPNPLLNYATTGVGTTVGGTRTELRTSAAPGMPVLEPPVRAIRAAAPDFEPSRPTVLPPIGNCPTGTCPTVRMAPDRPPPVLLPPEIPRPVRP